MNRGAISRKNRRANCTGLARVWSSSGVSRGRCRDVSDGGAFIEGVQANVGEHAELLLEVGEVGSLRAMGEVTRATPDVGIAIRFHRLDFQSLVTVRRLLDDATSRSF